MNLYAKDLDLIWFADPARNALKPKKGED